MRIGGCKYAREVLWAILAIAATHAVPSAATEHHASGMEWVEVGLDPLQHVDYVALRNNGVYVRSNQILSYWSWVGQIDQLELSRQTTISYDCGGVPTSDGQFVVNWLGRAHPYEGYIHERQPPLDDETRIWSEPPLSGSGYTISQKDRVCRNDECRQIIGLAAGHSPLGYILGGRALVAHTPTGAQMLTPDGQRILGVIGHAGSGGWIYVDTGPSEDSRSQPRLNDNSRLRGRMALEVLQGNPHDNLRCAEADIIHAWSSCSTEFSRSGTLSKRLATLRTIKPSEP